jgi:EAL domain-containing protein (putative c-di-GMP-specific phosphodiesterase class I)
VSVSLPAGQHDADDLAAMVSSALRSSALVPSRLELDVTEGAFMNGSSEASRALMKVRELGVGIALDHFGTERSAPSSLRDFPFSRIKLDARLTAASGTTAAARSITRMLVELGHARGMEVVAKGVEAQEQLAFLREVGCDSVQGSYVGCPAPIVAFSALTDRLPADSDNEVVGRVPAALLASAARPNSLISSNSDVLGG